MERLSCTLVDDTLCFEFCRDFSSAVSKSVRHIENFLDGNGFSWVDLDVIKLLVLFPDAALFDQLISIWGAAAPKPALLNDDPAFSLANP